MIIDHVKQWVMFYSPFKMLMKMRQSSTFVANGIFMKFKWELYHDKGQSLPLHQHLNNTILQHIYYQVQAWLMSSLWRNTNLFNIS